MATKCEIKLIVNRWMAVLWCMHIKYKNTKKKKIWLETVDVLSNLKTNRCFCFFVGFENTLYWFPKSENLTQRPLLKDKLYFLFKFDTQLSLKRGSFLTVPVMQKSPLNPSLHPFIQVPLTLLHVWLFKQLPHTLVQFSP